LQALSGFGGVGPVGVLVGSQLCFSGRWCLVALWWCVRSVLTVFGDVLGRFAHVLVVFGGVVSRHCSGGVLEVLKEWYFLD
jgi:hypothetical protein